MKNILTTLIFLSMCATSQAFELDLMRGVYTDHLNKGEFNEENNLTGLRTEKYFLFAFRNSYKQPSYAVGRRYQLEFGGGWHVGAYVGLVSGYCKESFFLFDSKFKPEECVDEVNPMGALYGGYTHTINERWRVHAEVVSISTAVNAQAGIGYNF